MDVASLLSPANSHGPLNKDARGLWNNRSTVETTDVGLAVGSSALEMPTERKQVWMRYFNASAQRCMETLE